MSPGRTRWELSERPVTACSSAEAPVCDLSSAPVHETTWASGVREGELGRVRFSSDTTRGYRLARAACRPHWMGMVAGWVPVGATAYFCRT